jgi:hypothetical protein
MPATKGIKNFFAGNFDPAIQPAFAMFIRVNSRVKSVPTAKWH